LKGKPENITLLGIECNSDQNGSVGRAASEQLLSIVFDDLEGPQREWEEIPKKSLPSMLSPSYQSLSANRPSQEPIEYVHFAIKNDHQLEEYKETGMMKRLKIMQDKSLKHFKARVLAERSPTMKPG
jgi:hypothetical protein